MEWDVEGISELGGHVCGASRSAVVRSNYSSYGYEQACNYEHDDDASLHSYGACEDMIYSAVADHEGWQDGYDY